MNKILQISIKLSLLGIIVTFFFGCSTQKNNAANRSLQNLSARYNYIYNANVLLESYQESLAENHKENYEDFLTVYIAPEQIDYNAALGSTTSSKELDDITKKAQTIVSDKSLSNYIDEAYILLGKTNFYKGNYFTAIEYFDYTARAYKKDKKITQQALNWKARSLMQINNYKQASKILDTVGTNIDSVKSQKADPLATLAQLNIQLQNYKKAIFYLVAAIKESNKIESRTRWPYILGQLYEHEKEYDEALANYTKVENSNAPFEMYFNAKLSKIRIYDVLKDKTSNRKKQLLALLKDDKNLDYTEKIYYEVAEDYLEDENYTKAEEFYKSSAQKSTNNLYQKGLTFLKIADLNFKNLRNYVNAKLYYDSAAVTLPKNYPNYVTIVKKAENLEYLTKRYELIAQQDTLQFLAQLPEMERATQVQTLLFPIKAATVDSKMNKNAKTARGNLNESTTTGTFYFSNSNAISRGFTDFKKRWGNRPLANNWRQSIKSSAMVTLQNQNAAIDNNGQAIANLKNGTDSTQIDAIKAYIALLPLSDEKLKESNQKIIDAYFEIAGFYQQVIQDQTEAIKTYDTLLKRYPENNHLDAIFYSLALAYAQTDPAKAEQYKNMVLAKFPGTVYAKTILDPNYSVKQNALDLALNKTYNEVFTAYEQKDFQKIISKVDEVKARFPGNNLQVQYDYLKAIAIGKTQNLDSLLLAFTTIVAKYPDDKLISPLVKAHLTYIKANLASFKSRKIALIDFEQNEPRLIAPQQITPATQKEIDTKKALDLPKETQKIAVEQVEPKRKATTTTNKDPKLVVEKTWPTSTIKPADTLNSTTKVAVTNPAKVDELFNKAESTTYYYVVAVADASLSLSSSRFGIGQFNRGNFAGTGIKHQLLELEEDQLIYIGDFNSLADVKAYQESITPELSKIMKVPANSYNGFYISRENFEKLKNKDTLNRYSVFFKNNYSNE